MSAELVVVLHDAITPDAGRDELDNLVQVEAVTASLNRLGYDVVGLPFYLQRIGELGAQLKNLNPRCVVNLVESVEGSCSLGFTACAILDYLRVPYTGNGTQAMFTSINKLLTKRLLHCSGLHTPEWVESSDEGIYIPGERYVVKPVSDGGSVGIHDASVAVFQSREELVEKLRYECTAMGMDYFAERYIDGREFNISLLGNNAETEVLPAAEMLFVGYEERGLPRIVNYDAKWNPDSYAYHNSVRSFSAEESEAELVVRIKAAAQQCWNLFRLRGYVRVDFRIDSAGRPWIIDINANPCISADSGFIAAAAQAGLDYDGVIKRILRDAITKKSN